MNTPCATVVVAVLLCSLRYSFGNSAAAAGPPPSGTEFGFAVFQQHCAQCHGNPGIERAPTPAQLQLYSPERIYEALTTGPMKSVGDALSDDQRHLVSQALAGRPFGSESAGDAAAMPNRCANNPPLPEPSSAPQWNGWGAGLANTRFQSAADAKLDATRVGSLEVKWVFGLPNSTSSYSQPAIVSGRVFVGSDTGFIYSLDAATGCLYWSFRSKAGVRNAMTLGAIQGHPGTRYALFYGDLKANTYALDAQSGRLLWTTKVEDHYTARVTAAPALYAGRLYVPVSSWEEFAAAAPGYPCCSSVGSVVALDADTGRQVWKTYVIAERPKPKRLNSTGVQTYAPAGGSVWNTPTIDPRRQRIYFGTGDATTYPAARTSDSVMALDLDSGGVRWSYQVHRHDSFVGDCYGASKSDNCPKVQGPDWDIPCSVILTTVGNKDRLIVGTKPGDILALDPDRAGRLLWRVNVFGPIAGDAPPGATQAMPSNKGVVWGGAAEAGVVYFGLLGGGVAALRVADGGMQWLSPVGPPPPPGARPVAHAAAVSVIPGVLFAGGSDGTLSALGTTDGRVLWSFGTDRQFDAVNQVPTHGGSISAPGAVIADGMVLVGSGYGVLGGIPGNALIAFGTHFNGHSR
jgi:polyvinyl alcohol dehydrogenase (cytochrome)